MKAKNISSCGQRFLLYPEMKSEPGAPATLVEQAAHLKTFYLNIDRIEDIENDLGNLKSRQNGSGRNRFCAHGKKNPWVIERLSIN